MRAKPETKRLLVVAAFLFLLTLAPYLQTRHFDFLDFDDDGYITANQFVRSGLNFASAKWAFTSGGYAATWHPLTWLSLMTDVSLFGLSPGPMHVENALLHAAGAVALLLVLLRITGSLAAAFLAAAFWAVHPLRVESVAWVCQRKDVLGTLFGLLAMLAYVEGLWRTRYRDGGPLAGLTGLGRISGDTCFLLATVLFAVAFMCKPTVVMFPLLAAILEYALTGRVKWKHLEVALWLGLAGVLITVYTQGKGGTIMSQTPLPVRLANAVASLGIYLRQTVAPYGLAVLYPFREPDPLAVWAGKFVCFGLAAVLWFAGVPARGKAARPAGFGPHADRGSTLPYAAGVAWFLVAIVPMIGLVRISHHAYADRFTSWPSIGLAVAMAWGLAALRTPGTRSGYRAGLTGFLKWLCGAGVLAALFLVTLRQVATWRNTETLFRRAVAVTERNAIAELDLGMFLGSEERPQEGLPHLRLAALYDHTPAAFIRLTYGLALAGEVQEAAACASVMPRDEPEEPIALAALALLAKQRHTPEIAEQFFRQALIQSPAFASNWNDYGDLLASEGKWTEALTAWRQAVWLDSICYRTARKIARYESCSTNRSMTWQQLLTEPK